MTAKEAAEIVAGMSLEELELVDDDRKTVVDAVAARRRALSGRPRVFELVDGINSYSFGADPNYVVVAGEPLETTDAAFAERLAADEHFTEVTP